MLNTVWGSVKDAAIVLRRFLWSSPPVWELFHVRMRYSSIFECEKRWDLLSHLLVSPEFKHSSENLLRYIEIWVRIWNISGFQWFFFLRVAHRREKGETNSRKQVWANWYQVASTGGTETALLLSTGPGTLPQPCPCTLTVAHTDHRLCGPSASTATTEPLWDNHLLPG